MSINLISGGIAVDDRGSVRFVNDFDFSSVKRFYQVENHTPGFIRAWHGHKLEAKYVYVVKGTALVGAVELGIKAEPGKYILTAAKPSVLFIPANHANGFMTLEPDTVVMFFSTATMAETKDDDIRFPYNKWDIWNIEYR